MAGEHWRPSVKLRELLMGRAAWNDADPAIRSVASFEIYKAAVAILAMDGKGARRNALGKIPASIRPHVEAEVKRLWALRRGQ